MDDVYEHWWLNFDEMTFKEMEFFYNNDVRLAGRSNPRVILREVLIVSVHGPESRVNKCLVSELMSS